MKKEIKNTWKPDEDVHVSLGEPILSMMIYAECDDPIGYNAQYCSEEAVTENNLAIGRTKLLVTQKNRFGYIPVTISPYMVKYDKEVYRPGKVEILMHVNGGSPMQYAKILEDMFLNTECKVDLVTWSPGKKKYIFVAQEYYVDHLSLDRDADNAVVATLTCYSPDHKMTLDKFCQAYSGQRFATDILTAGIARFKGTADFSLDPCDLMFLAYDARSFDVNALSRNCDDGVIRDEMIQAYLLQYNESFYDFLCRIANRCGEFLYYEDGKLHIGLPESTRRIMDMSAKDITLLTPHGITYPKLKSKVESGLKTGTFLYDPVYKTNKEPKADTCYMAGHSAPNNTTFKDFKIPDIDIFKDGRFIVGILSRFAAAGDAGEAAASVLFEIALSFINNKTDKYKMGTRYWQLFYYNLMTGKTEGVPVPPLNSDAVKLADNLSQEFYSQIRKLEEEVTDDMIVMDFDNEMPDASLASAVTIEDGFSNAFIVTKMKGVFMAGDQRHTLTVVPRVSAKGRLSRSIDTSRALLVPPLLKAESNTAIAPMEAVVMDAKDPFRLGRVRVNFLWQHAEDYNWTDWIPMSTPFAGQKGNGGGIFMMPQVGTHVIVNFFDNDIHHPYVSGSLYNSEQEAPGYGAEYGSLPKLPQPYSPYNQVMTIQSANGHGITFADDSDIDILSDVLCPTAGAVVKGIARIKDNDKNGSTSLKFTKNWAQAKGGGITLADKSGFYNISMSSTKREINISCPLGEVKMDAFTGITISAPNGDIDIKGKNVSITAGNNLTIKSGANVKTDGTKLGAVGGGFGNTLAFSTLGYLAGIGVARVAMEGIALGKLCDFHFLRSSWEVLMRPVEGTLSLSTARNITMTAGQGKVVVPAVLQSNVKTGPLYKKTYQQILHDADDLLLLKESVEKAKDIVSGFYDKRHRAVAGIQENVSALQKLLESFDIGSLSKEKSDILNFFDNKKCHNKAKLYECIRNMGTDVKYVDSAGDGFHLKNGLDIKNYIEKTKEECSPASLAKEITDGIKSIKSLKVSESDLGSSLWPKGMDDELFNEDEVIVVDDGSRKDKLKCTQRKAIIAILRQGGLFNIPSNVDVEDDDAWNKFVQNLPDAGKPAPTIKDSLKGVGALLGNIVGSTLNVDSLLGLLNVDTTAQQMVNFNGKQGPYAFADISSGGSILMSNDPAFTHQLDGKAMKLDNNNSTMAALLATLSQV